MIIDGYFEDWQNIEKYADADIVNNPNADIDEYAGITQGDESFFYLSVKGNMLSGVMIPSPEARVIPNLDPGPDPIDSDPIDIVDLISDPIEPPPLPTIKTSICCDSRRVFK